MFVSHPKTYGIRETPDRRRLSRLVGIVFATVAVIGLGSNCDLRHRLALRPLCGGEPTFTPERRQCAGKRT